MRAIARWSSVGMRMLNVFIAGKFMLQINQQRNKKIAKTLFVLHCNL